MSTDEKSNVPSLLEQTGIKSNYTYEPTISQTQLIIEVPDDARLSNELSVLIEKLRHPDDLLTTRQEELYQQLLASIPPAEIDRFIITRPLLERRNVVIKISKSSEQNKPDFRGKKNSNLTAVVSNFKSKRLEELRQRINELEQEASGLILCATTGVAGSGKSELAKAYAWELPRSPDVFRWRLDPDPDTTDNKATKVSYQQAYSELIYNFGIQSTKVYETETPEQMHRRLLSMLWQKINQYPKWIIIFDNAESYTDIKDYLPTDPCIKGLILITTRQSHFLKDKLEANFSLNQGLEEKEAIQLLTELSGQHEEEGARNLVKELDHSPLGTRIAGCYIQNMGTTFETYTRFLQTSVHEKIIDRMGGPEFTSQATQDAKRTTTLQMALQFSITKVKESHPLLFTVLQYCGYLANENIPLDLLVQLYEPSEQKTEEVEEELRALMVGKENYSLLTYDVKNQSCYLHRTTQVIIRGLTPSEIKVVQKLAAVILRSYPYDEYSIQRVKLGQGMVLHLVALLQWIRSDPERASALMTQRLQLGLVLAQLLQSLDQYVSALQYLQEMRDIVPASSDANLEIQVEILRFMGRIRYYLRQYEKAKIDLNRAFKIHGQTDWKSAQIYNDLGNILRQDPRSEEGKALEAFHKAEQICEKCRSVSKDSKNLCLQLAESHLGVGRCLSRSKNPIGALEYLEKALAIRQQYLGPDHPQTATVYENLGTLCLATNQEMFADIGIDYRTSLQYLEKALLISKATYGPSSHRAAMAYQRRSCLLYVSQNPQDWERALQDLNQTIEIYGQILSLTSEDLITFLYWKGRILEKLNQEAEAMSAYRHSVELGQKHPQKREDIIQKSKQRLQEIQITMSMRNIWT